MYALTQEADVNSNYPEKIKLNKGNENKLVSKSNYLGTYRI